MYVLFRRSFDVWIYTSYILLPNRCQKVNHFCCRPLFDDSLSLKHLFDKTKQIFPKSHL